VAYRKTHIGPKIRSLRKKEKLWKKLWFWLIVFIVIAGIGGCYIVCFLPQLQIKNIVVSGNNSISGDDIKAIAEKDVAQNIMGSRSIILTKSHILVTDILQQFPTIENVWVRKIYPSTMSISVKERQAVSTFCQTINCFAIDGNGIIFQQITGVPEGMIITSDTPHDMRPGSQVVEKKVMDLIIAVRKSLKENFNINVTNTFVSNPVVFTTHERWKMYFSPDNTEQNQITRMEALLNKIPADVRKKLEYIYLQYKDRAYYK